MRCSLHGNIRISLEIRKQCTAQRFEIASLPQRLVHLDTDPKFAILRNAVHHFAEHQPVVLVDADRRAGWERLPQHEAQSPSRKIDRAPPHRAPRSIAQHSHGQTLIRLNARFPASFHKALIDSKPDKMNLMSADFVPVFAALKTVLARHADGMQVKADTPIEYTLLTAKPSPFKQHKGQPMYFGSVRLGKAYVSFHLLPLYMSPALNAHISPALKKRMQGKACFNFKSTPDPALIAELSELTAAGLKDFQTKDWA